MRRRRLISSLISYILICIISIWIIFPFYWIIVSTTKTGDQLYTQVPQFFSWPITFENYIKVFKDMNFLVPLRNSIVYGFITSFITVAIASIGAYSLAKIKYKGKRYIIFLLFITQMLPAVLMIVSIYFVFAKLQITNTHFGMIIGYITFALPFSLLLLRNFFSSFPDELVEASFIDGCNELGAIRRIIIPLSISGIIAAFLFTFILVWNDLLFSMVLSRDTQHKTAAVAIALQLGGPSSIMDWGYILSAGLIITVPLLIIFVFLQKYLVLGMTAGSIKE